MRISRLIAARRQRGCGRHVVSVEASVLLFLFLRHSFQFPASSLNINSASGFQSVGRRSEATSPMHADTPGGLIVLAKNVGQLTEPHFAFAYFQTFRLIGVNVNLAKLV